MEAKPVENKKKSPPRVQKPPNPAVVRNPALARNPAAVRNPVKKNPAPAAAPVQAPTQSAEKWNVRPPPTVTAIEIPLEAVKKPIKVQAVTASPSVSATNNPFIKVIERAASPPMPELKEPEPVDLNQSAGKTREQIKAEREAKKLEKLAKKSKDSPAEKPKAAANVATVKPDKENIVQDLTAKTEQLHITEEKVIQKPAETPGKPKATKEERRALQEAQRKAKEEKMTPLKKVTDKDLRTPAKQAVTFVPPTPKTPKASPASSLHKVKLFKHLYTESCSLDLNVNGNIHPAIVKIGVQFAQNEVVGCNSRCLAFLKALKMVSISTNI